MQPTQLKLDLFFKDYNEYHKTNISVVSSSFFEARLKIKPEVFKELNLEFINWYYNANKNLKKFDKFNVYASSESLQSKLKMQGILPNFFWVLDGSYFEIPADAKLKKHFEYKSKSDTTNTVRAGVNVIFSEVLLCKTQACCACSDFFRILDVCNNKTICSQMHKYTKWVRWPPGQQIRRICAREQESFEDLFEEFLRLNISKEPNNLFIFDRGFSSSKLVKLIENQNMFYLFRLKRNAFKFIPMLKSSSECLPCKHALRAPNFFWVLDEVITHTTYDKITFNASQCVCL